MSRHENITYQQQPREVAVGMVRVTCQDMKISHTNSNLGRLLLGCEGYMSRHENITIPTATSGGCCWDVIFTCQDMKISHTNSNLGRLLKGW